MGGRHLAAFAAQVVDVARGLVASGVEPGDRVALLSRTRYEWTLFDYAIVAAGAVTVPIYETSSAEQVGLDPLRLRGEGRGGREDHRHAATVTGTEDARRARLADRGRRRLAGRGGGAHHARRVGTGGCGCTSAGPPPGPTTWPRSSTPPAPPAARRAASSPTPTSCRGAHGRSTVLPEVLDGARLAPAVPPAGTRLRPGRAVRGRRQPHRARPHPRREAPPGRPRDLPADVAARRPPGVREGLQRRAAQGRRRRQGQDLRRRRGHGDRVERGAATRAAPAPVLRLQHALFDKLVYGKLRAALGGRCRRPSPAAPRWATGSGHFFRGIGVTVLEGYGLTETTAGDLGQHHDDAQRIGTVGRPLPGRDDPHRRRRRDPRPRPIVFRGYWKNDGRHRRGDRPTAGSTPATSASSTSDGFLRDHRAQEGDHRHRRAARTSPPPCSRTACARTAGQPVHRRRRRAALHRGAGHPRRGGPAAWLEAARQARGPTSRRTSSRTRSCAPRSPPRSRTPTGPCRRPRRSRSSASCRRDFTEENGELTPTLKLKRVGRHEGVRRRRRGALRGDQTSLR